MSYFRYVGYIITIRFCSFSLLNIVSAQQVCDTTSQNCQNVDNYATYQLEVLQGLHPSAGSELAGGGKNSLVCPNPCMEFNATVTQPTGCGETGLITIDAIGAEGVILEYGLFVNGIQVGNRGSVDVFSNLTSGINYTVKARDSGDISCESESSFAMIDECPESMCGDTDFDASEDADPNTVCDVPEAACIPAVGSSCTYCNATCGETTVTYEPPVCGDTDFDASEDNDPATNCDEVEGVCDNSVNACTYCGGGCMLITLEAEDPVCGEAGFDASEDADPSTVCDAPEAACTPAVGSSCTYCNATCGETTVTYEPPLCGDTDFDASEDTDPATNCDQVEGMCDNSINACTYCGGGCMLITLQPEDPVCGDVGFDASEDVDLATNCNIPSDTQNCTPLPGGSCTYCSTTCVQITVEDTEIICGDGVIGGTEQCEVGVGGATSNNCVDCELVCRGAIPDSSIYESCPGNDDGLVEALANGQNLERIALPAGVSCDNAAKCAYHLLPECSGGNPPPAEAVYCTTVQGDEDDQVVNVITPWSEVSDASGCVTQTDCQRYVPSECGWLDNSRFVRFRKNSYTEVPDYCSPGGEQEGYEFQRGPGAIIRQVPQNSLEFYAYWECVGDGGVNECELYVTKPPRCVDLGLTTSLTNVTQGSSVTASWNVSGVTAAGRNRYATNVSLSTDTQDFGSVTNGGSFTVPNIQNENVIVLSVDMVLNDPEFPSTTTTCTQELFVGDYESVTLPLPETTSRSNDDEDQGEDQACGSLDSVAIANIQQWELKLADLPNNALCDSTSNADITDSIQYDDSLPGWTWTCPDLTEDGSDGGDGTDSCLAYHIESLTNQLSCEDAGVVLGGISTTLNGDLVINSDGVLTVETSELTQSQLVDVSQIQAMSISNSSAIDLNSNLTIGNQGIERGDEIVVSYTVTDKTNINRTVKCSQTIVVDSTADIPTQTPGCGSYDGQYYFGFWYTQENASGYCETGDEYGSDLSDTGDSWTRTCGTDNGDAACEVYKMQAYTCDDVNILGYGVQEEFIAGSEVDIITSVADTISTDIGAGLTNIVVGTQDLSINPTITVPDSGSVTMTYTLVHPTGGVTQCEVSIPVVEQGGADTNDGSADNNNTGGAGSTSSGGGGSSSSIPKSGKKLDSAQNSNEGMIAGSDGDAQEGGTSDSTSGSTEEGEHYAGSDDICAVGWETCYYTDFHETQSVEFVDVSDAQAGMINQLNSTSCIYLGRNDSKASFSPEAGATVAEVWKSFARILRLGERDIHIQARLDEVHWGRIYYDQLSARVDLSVNPRFLVPSNFDEVMGKRDVLTVLIDVMDVYAPGLTLDKKQRIMSAINQVDNTPVTRSQLVEVIYGLHIYLQREVVYGPATPLAVGGSLYDSGPDLENLQSLYTCAQIAKDNELIDSIAYQDVLEVIYEGTLELGMTKETYEQSGVDSEIAEGITRLDKITENISILESDG